MPSETSKITTEQVRAAREMLKNIVPVSRIISSEFLSKASGAKIFLKLECEGPTGSFKVRGAYHAIRRKLESGSVEGVVTSSTGNHGAATAFAANQMGMPAKIFLPEYPNPAKRTRIEQQGAEIVEVGKYLEETREHAARFAEESGWFNLVDGTESGMLPGTATIGAEILEQVPNVDVVFVPVGDSTLIQGVSFAVKSLCPEARVIGVQAKLAPAYALGFAKGHGISTDSSDTIADGLSVRDATEENVHEIRKTVDEFLLVTDEEMLSAVKQLKVNENLRTEPSGAATIAALLQTAQAHAGKTVVLLVTGANISEEMFLRAMQS
jgi:threonine dehydratase